MSVRRPDYSRYVRLAASSDTSVRYVVTTMPREERWHDRAVVRTYYHSDVLGVLRRLRRLARERDVMVHVYWGLPPHRHGVAWTGSYIARARGEAAL